MIVKKLYLILERFYFKRLKEVDLVLKILKIQMVTVVVFKKNLMLIKEKERNVKTQGVKE